MVLALHDRELGEHIIELTIVFFAENGSHIRLPLSLTEFSYRAKNDLVLGGLVLPDYYQNEEERDILQSTLRWLDVDDMPYYRAHYQAHQGWMQFTTEPLIPRQIFKNSLF